MDSKIKDESKRVKMRAKVRQFRDRMQKQRQKEAGKIDTCSWVSK